MLRAAPLSHTSNALLPRYESALAPVQSCMGSGTNQSNNFRRTSSPSQNRCEPSTQHCVRPRRHQTFCDALTSLATCTHLPIYVVPLNIIGLVPIIGKVQALMNVLEGRPWHALRGHRYGVEGLTCQPWVLYQRIAAKHPSNLHTKKRAI